MELKGFNMNDILKQGCNILSSVYSFLEKWQLLRPIELALLALLCFLSGRFLTYIVGWGDVYFSGFWVILVALLVTKDPEIKLSDLQSRIMSVALGVLGGFVVLSVFGINPISLFVSVALISWVCAFFHWHEFQQLAILSLVVLVVSNYLNSDIEIWASAIGRILEAGVGMLLAYASHYVYDYARTCCTSSCASSNKSK